MWGIKHYNHNCKDVKFAPISSHQTAADLQLCHDCNNDHVATTLKLKNIIHKCLHIVDIATENLYCPDINKETSNEDLKLTDEKVVGLYPYNGICVGKFFSDSEINRIEIQYVRKCNNYLMCALDIVTKPLDDILAIIDEHHEKEWNNSIPLVDYIYHTLKEYIYYVMRLLNTMSNKIPDIYYHVISKLTKDNTIIKKQSINVWNLHSYSRSTFKGLELSQIISSFNKAKTPDISTLRNVIIDTIMNVIHIRVMTKRVNFVNNIIRNC